MGGCEDEVREVGGLRWEGLFLPVSWGLWGVLIKKARVLTDWRSGRSPPAAVGQGE